MNLTTGQSVMVYIFLSGALLYVVCVLVFLFVDRKSRKKKDGLKYEKD